MTKPRLFIGCSREAIPYARAVHEQLGRYAQVRPWFADAFTPNEYPMESLEKCLDSSDFAVFIFAPDDVVLLRGNYYFQPRDNTLFEMGLFWGKLRRDRVFCLVPEKVEARDDLVIGERVSEFHLLSDLQGLSVLRYESVDEEGNYAAAVTVACGKIIDAIQKKGLFVDPRRALEDMKTVLSRKMGILRFLWEYIQNVTISAETEKFNAICEAIRNSLAVPTSLRVTGAALWRRLDSGRIVQTGGNVGKGRDIEPRPPGEGDKPSLVAETFEKGEWNFYERREIGMMLYILSYPVNEGFVLTVHMSADESVSQDQLCDIVRLNEDLLQTVHHLLGGSA